MFRYLLAGLAILLPLYSAAAQAPASRSEEGRRMQLRQNYARQVQSVEQQLELTEAEIQSWKRRLDWYQDFTKAAYSDPFLHDREFMQLALRGAEMKRDSLRKDLIHLLRHRAEYLRLDVGPNAELPREDRD